MRNIVLLGFFTATHFLSDINIKQHARVGSPSEEIIASSYPKDYFVNPVNHAVKLTGTFGELRANHYHAGIDIDGSTGNAIVAAAEGYIAQIKVLSGGYGHVLYIRHPAGYTTLYAHLDRFSPEIQAFVRQQQQLKQRFEVNLRPPPTMFPVRKGQEIGKMGNTGGSAGPHLHFEIRHTATQKVINPQLFGITEQDTSPPDIRDLKVYFLDSERAVLGSQVVPLNKQAGGVIGLEGDTLTFGADRIGFGIKSYDMMNGFRNDNGIYALSLFVEEELQFSWCMDQLNMDETRYINAHIDYPVQRKYGAWFHRCFVLPGDKLSNYHPTTTMGAISLHPEKPVAVRIRVTDAAGNQNNLRFYVKLDASRWTEQVETPGKFVLLHNKENRFILPTFTMTMPPGSVYENMSLNYYSNRSTPQGAYSPMHYVHHEGVPVHRYYELSILPESLPDNLKNKAVIAKCGSGKPDNCGASWKGEFLMTKVREFGNYCILIDTIPPTIHPAVFKPDMRKYKSMSFRISDNMAVNGLADALYYKGSIDGRWVLFTYDKKSAGITYTLEDWIGKGSHRINLEVTDDRGNTAVFNRNFTR
jgi:hypothetical protein